MDDSKTVKKIRMRHPHTSDEVEVEATSEAVIPYMVKGYQQVLAESGPRPGDADGPAEEQVTLAEPEKD